MGVGRNFREDFALVVLDREQAVAADRSRARRSASSRWPLRWSWLLILMSSLALWAGLIALMRVLF
jgi:hypothetical protein